MHFVVAYDVVDDRRRAKIHDTLKDFGTPVQYSVFECRLNEEQALRLADRLERLLHPKQDSLIFYPLCEKCRRLVTRFGRAPGDLGDLIVIGASLEPHPSKRGRPVEPR